MRFRKKMILISILIFLLVCCFLLRQQVIPLSSHSSHVSAHYTLRHSTVSAQMDLVSLTEQEIFHDMDTAIFRGTILSTRNIVLNFQGVQEYRAIAQIAISQSYRGPYQSGDNVSILVPCALGMNGSWTEDCETVSCMDKGIEGIFMMCPYTENSYYEENGGRLALMDLANGGFPDGDRFAFLQTEKGLQFSQYTYESLANASSLNEIEDFVKKMITQD